MLQRKRKIQEIATPLSQLAMTRMWDSVGSVPFISPHFSPGSREQAALFVVVSILSNTIIDIKEKKY